MFCALPATKLGLLTLFLDVFKGALPVFIAVHLISESPENPWEQAYLSLIAAICIYRDICYPLYLGLRGGGKGVATAWGCFSDYLPRLRLWSHCWFL